ncbi:Dynein light chain 1 [Theileria parva strain Muguga]|uniref:Dynein light chain n=1 Tax=Theileria parva TaxID=5875 RepID=Q4N980_THEPA|nr:Dynein light chain 1 [Theileria parva strain Muguga]EAN33478.1 Dynein light chain 1 [Theileria parva strain Muguga]|eukprot:XP_765761.1 dynein light chain 1 [Theileria parva strain Muguga]
MATLRNDAKPTVADAVIKNVDMDETTKTFALKVAVDAITKFEVEKDIAGHIKKEFDKTYEPTWHCIVGKNFGSYVTHEKQCFIYFYLGKMAILIFKNG